MYDASAHLGIVLAGGASRRLGRDKRALLTPAGQTLLGAAITRLEPLVREVWVLCDPGFVPPEPLPPGARLVGDPAPGSGPLCALAALTPPRDIRGCVVTGVDIPNVPAALLARLVQLGCETATAAVVPRCGGNVEPLCAWYAAETLGAFAARVRQGEAGMQAALRALGAGVRWVGPEELSTPATLWDTIFLNINSPAEFERWQQQQP